MTNKNTSCVRFAFQQSFPVMFGYLFMGFAFGLMLRQAGYGALWSFAFGGLVYAGSLQFLVVDFLVSGAALSTVLLMSLFINARHIFYGLSFLEKFKAMGSKRHYAIFGLTDETYSVLCSLKTPPGVDENKAIFLITLFNQLYWVCGCTLGGAAGSLPLDFTGIEFSMTALFTVIFLGQWEQSPSHLPALVGLCCAGIFLLLFGPDAFLLPAILATVTV